MTKAYDIVAWSVYINGHGNALALYRTGDEDRAKVPKAIGPAALRQFCNRVGIPELPCSRVIRETVSRALDQWPAMIDTSNILDVQKFAC